MNILSFVCDCLKTSSNFVIAFLLSMSGRKILIDFNFDFVNVSKSGYSCLGVFVFLILQHSYNYVLRNYFNGIFFVDVIASMSLLV